MMQSGDRREDRGQPASVSFAVLGHSQQGPGVKANPLSILQSMDDSCNHLESSPNPETAVHTSC